MNNTPHCIWISLWCISLELFTLAKAIKKVHDDNKEKIKIIFPNDTWFVEYDGDKLVPYEHIHSKNITVFHKDIWDSYNFQKYSENKRYTHLILSNSCVHIPQEVYVPSQDKINQEKIWKLRWEYSVIKPLYGECWEGVIILPKNDILWYLQENHINYPILIQEKIENLPLNVNGKQQDWNVRVLITYCFDTRQHVCAWLVVRYGNCWEPVNISLTAKYMSLNDLCNLTWLTHIQEKLEYRIQQAAICAVNTLVEQWKKYRNNKNLNGDEQILAWVDIIVTPDQVPYVIEVNNCRSWCMYELVQLEWFNSIYPIAQWVIKKAKKIIQG